MRGPTRIAALLALCAATAFAQEEGQENLQRITPLQNSATEEMFTTKHPVEPPANTQAMPAPPAPPPAAQAPAIVPFGTGGHSQANRYSPDKVPFGRAEPAAPIIPSGPHSTVATPVDDVDTVDATEPVPPTPVAIEENPAAQDPAEPTELTSPIFDEKNNPRGPRKITIRVLNKVTAQSQLFKAEPGATAKFGRLEITAVSCRISAPNSLKDYAGLFEINEQLPEAEAKKKLLFRGWMYTSSPSIAALEHPIYDVTMVSCDTADAKAEEKPDKKSDKKTEKKSKK